ncbi:hypothetical protein K474DRAFT_1709348 [Panus rudis PR-1116 ss-1]|nr:hypothetical protein K474DRAFT_1709348 [Panus rudis PR-1116 ss-1]
MQFTKALVVLTTVAGLGSTAVAAPVASPRPAPEAKALPMPMRPGHSRSLSDGSIHIEGLLWAWGSEVEKEREGEMTW